jgi:hypothetical protein
MGRFLYQGVLEQVGRMRRHPLPERQTGRNETVEAPSLFGRKGLVAIHASCLSHPLHDWHFVIDAGVQVLVA